MPNTFSSSFDKNTSESEDIPTTFHSNLLILILHIQLPSLALIFYRFCFQSLYTFMYSNPGEGKKVEKNETERNTFRKKEAKNPFFLIATQLFLLTLLK